MMTHHAEAETLAAFMDGTLDRDELDAVTAHLGECEECRAVLGEVAVFEEQETRISRRRWMAVAAAVVMVVGIGTFARGYWHRREIASNRTALFLSVPDQKRLMGRFAGQDVWRENRTMRGDEKDEDLSLAVAASRLQETVGDDTSPNALRAIAAALAYTKHTTEALETLERIPAMARDAAVWNDIAVLRLQLGKRDALDAVERALQSQPQMPEALFNRAAILYANGDPRAVSAYEQYLKVDPAGSWAEDARRQIEQIRSLQ